ncbi:MAG: thioredoxin family protein [Bacilli bacterium]|jgi:thiol-disulfide isomerase/thioredoxin
MKILKFGAVWCPGCLVMKPRFLEIEKEYPWLHTEFYDCDEDQEMFKQWKVNDVLPVFIFLDQNNQEILRLIGEQSKKKIIDLILKNKDK